MNTRQKKSVHNPKTVGVCEIPHQRQVQSTIKVPVFDVLARVEVCFRSVVRQEIAECSFKRMYNAVVIAFSAQVFELFNIKDVSI